MSLTKKEFEEMKKNYPEIVGIMAKGSVYASSQLSLNMYDLAIGGRKMYKQVLATETIYDENGKKVKTIQIPKTICYQLEPNFYANKFLLEHKEKVVYGDEKREEKENEVLRDLRTMDKEDLYKAKALVIKDDLTQIKGGRN